MSRRTVIVGILVGILAAIGAGIGGFAVWQLVEQRVSNGLLAEARSQARAGELDEAMRFFRKYLARRRGDVEVRREYADVLLTKLRAGKLGGKGDVSASKLLETAVRESPDDHWLRFQLAKFQKTIGQHTSAIEHLKTLQQACGPNDRFERKSPDRNGPDDSIDRKTIDVLLAECLSKTGQFQEAVTILSPLIGFDPVARAFTDPARSPQSEPARAGSSHAIFDQLATILGDSLEDEAAGERVIIQNTVINADDAAAWIALGRWKYLYSRDIPAAKQAVQKAVEISPDDSMVMYCHFMVSHSAQEYAKVAALADRGLELHPDQEWPYEAKAILGLHNRDVASTLDFLVAGLKKLGGRPALLQRLVDLPDEPVWNDAIRERLADIGAALDAQPRFRLVLDARKLMTSHRWLDALALLDQARPLAVTSPPLKLAIDLAQAKCHAHLGDTDLQLSACRRAVAENPMSVEARAGLAMALLACGQTDLALKEFRTATEPLSPSELAEKPEIWGPMVRLERTAIERRLPGRRDRSEVEKLVASLKEHVDADHALLLDIESNESTTADDRTGSDTTGDLRAEMVALGDHIRNGQAEEAKAVATRVEALAGSDSTHARYAKVAVWALEKRLASARLPTRERAEVEPIRKQLAEIELLRPDWPELNCLVGEVDLLEGKTDEAIARYRKALAARPSDPHIARLLATILMKSHRFAEAEQVLAGLEPAVVDQLGLIAVELRLRAGKVDDAVAIALRTIESGTDDPDELARLADLLAANDRPSEAAQVLERSVSLDPKRLDFWLALTDLQASAHDDDAARATLERALKAAPASNRVLRAEQARREGRIDEAASAFRSMLEQPAKDMLILRRAAECFVEARETKEARAALDAMMKIRPRNAIDEEAKRWAHRRLAELLLRDGTFPEAEQAIVLLAENSGGVGSCTPEDADLAIRLLALRPEPKSWRVATEMLAALAKQQPLSLRQKLLEGKLLERLGGWRTARTDLLGMALQPGITTDVYAVLVDMLIAHDDLTTAETWIGELASRSPDEPETIALQARLAKARGDKPAATQAAKRLMPDRDVTPETLQADLATAATLESLGFPKAADKLFSQAAALGADGIVARIAFLIRQGRLDEATSLVESARETAKGPEFALLEADLLARQKKPDEAEKVYRRLLAGPPLPVSLRAEATGGLAGCLVDRGELKDAKDLVDLAFLEIGPHPALLDARGMASLAAGDLQAALDDFAEAVLAPTPTRLLHAVHAYCVVGNGEKAYGHLQQAVKLGLTPGKLKPSDRQRMEYIAMRLGLPTS